MKTRKVWWPPKAERPKHQGRTRVNREGEPITVQLKRFLPDNSMRCVIDNGCCDCGLRHHLIFEVFRDAKGDWYLNKRAYRIEP